MKRIVTTAAAILMACSLMFAQSGYQVKGVVVDASGPVIGATVIEAGTTNGVSTGLDGEFSLTASEAGATIEITCIGYTSQSFRADGVPALITLETDSEFLEDVVVIGYGTVKKNDMTGSVSTIKADQINKGIVTSPAQLLAGKSGGVVVTAGDGMPGSASTIRIRGGSSLNASNDPLVVIDGLPVGGTGISGMSDALSSINPSDIESFTVLKDASATAIYGSRASNGVIIITTKKGAKGGKVHVNADFTASISQNAKYVDLLDADGMKAAMQQYYPDKPDALAALGEANTDWQKQIYRIGQNYEANVGVSGTKDWGKVASLPWRVSAGYLSQKGTLKTSSLDRGTLSLNLTPSFMDNHLTVALNGKGMYMHNQFANYSAIEDAIQMDPTQPVFSDEEGRSLNGYFSWGKANTVARNPVADLAAKKDLSNAYRFIGNAQIDYKIHGLEDLRLNVNLGIDWSKSKGTVDIAEGSEFSYHEQSQNGLGQHTDYDQMRRDETLEAYIAYDHTWNNKHSFGAMVGYSWQHFYHESNNLSIAPDQSKTYNDTHNKFEHYLVSFFGRLNYSYGNRYLITATLRADGTSRFDNNRWGLFPSVALAWNVKNEHFLKNVDAVSALKLRLSYGQTGQQDVAGDSYPSIGTYYTATQGGWYKFGDEVIKPIMPREYNTDLKWETTTTYNIGLDFGFLDNRLTFSVDGYWRKTKDLLNYTPVAAGSNLKNFLNANIGTLENKGVELDINYVAIQTRDWYWQIGVNGAYNQNKITKLTSNDADESYRGVDTGGIAGGTGNTIQKYMTGYPAPTFYVYKQVYDTDGQPIMGAYEDLNNDGKIDEGDKYYCKQAAPKFTIGLNTTLCYKNWTLAISAHSNLGNYVYDNNLARLSLITDLWTNNFVANRTPQGVKDGFTKVQYHSDYYIRNASFFKLDNITLGYDFQLPKDMKLNLFATVQNVCVATRYSGVDPEVFNGIDSNLWPRPRTYMIGLKFNF